MPRNKLPILAASSDNLQPIILTNKNQMAVTKIYCQIRELILTQCLDGKPDRTVKFNLEDHMKSVINTLAQVAFIVGASQSCSGHEPSSSSLSTSPSPRAAKSAIELWDETSCADLIATSGAVLPKGVSAKKLRKSTTSPTGIFECVMVHRAVAYTYGFNYFDQSGFQWTYDATIPDNLGPNTGLLESNAIISPSQVRASSSIDENGLTISEYRFDFDFANLTTANLEEVLGVNFSVPAEGPSAVSSDGTVFNHTILFCIVDQERCQEVTDLVDLGSVIANEFSGRYRAGSQGFFNRKGVSVILRRTSNSRVVDVNYALNKATLEVNFLKVGTYVLTNKTVMVNPSIIRLGESPDNILDSDASAINLAEGHCQLTFDLSSLVGFEELVDVKLFVIPDHASQGRDFIGQIVGQDQPLDLVSQRSGLPSYLVGDAFRALSLDKNSLGPIELDLSLRDQDGAPYQVYTRADGNPRVLGPTLLVEYKTRTLR